MLTLAARRAALRPAAYARLARLSSSDADAQKTPDTGGPLFSSQVGTPIHKPSKGGDTAAEPAERKEPVDTKPASKAHKVQGSLSFAELKRMRQDGRE